MGNRQNWNVQKAVRPGRPGRRRLLMAAAAVLSIFLVKWTGLDGGMIDEVLESAIEAFEETGVSVEEIKDLDAEE